MQIELVRNVIINVKIVKKQEIIAYHVIRIHFCKITNVFNKINV